MKYNYCDLYYTFIKTWDGENVNDKNGINENDYIIYDIFNILKNHVGVEPHETIIR